MEKKFFSFILLLMFQKQNFLNNIFFSLIIFIFLFIPFFQSLYFFEVAWNFEWAKSIIFIILSSLVWIIFFFKEEKIIFPTLILFFFSLLILTSLFTDFPLTNILGEFKRGQGIFFYTSLAFLFIFLKTLSQKEKNILLYILLFTSSFFSIIALWEYFFPSGNYIIESKRAFWTFGNPHHLALYLLMLFPFFFENIFTLIPQENLKKKNKINRSMQRIIFIFQRILNYFQSFTFLKKHKNNKDFFSLVWGKIFLLPFFIINIFTLFFTKSFLWIIVFILYSFYFFSWKNYKKTFIFSVLIIIAWLLVLFFFFPEKLHSLLARIFIWQSVITIIFSELKIFFFWAWVDTLSFLFGNFKSPSLYIFENFWFQADRAHNIFLDFFYHFWIFGFLFIFFIFSFILKKFQKKAFFESLIIFVAFLFFNIPSISSFMLFIFFLSFIEEKNREVKNKNQNNVILSNIQNFKLLEKAKFRLVKKRKNNFYIKNIFTIKILFISFFLWIIILFSCLYIWEVFAYKKDFKTASKFFSHPSYLYEKLDFNLSRKLFSEKSPDYFIKKILNFWNSEDNCNDLLKKYPSGENYFFCWDILKQKWRYSQAKYFYRIGMKKIPNLWNKNSPYWDNFFVKNTISGNRFFSEKYSNLREILFFVNQ